MREKMKWTTKILIIMLISIIAGCTQRSVTDGADTTEPGDNVVEMRDTQFIPPSISILAGETVIFRNEDNDAHTVTGFGVDVQLEPEETYTHLFEESGTFQYVCSIHPGMSGQVIVR